MSLAAPYPGTFLYKQAVENGWLDADHAELVDDHGVQIAPLHYPHLSHEEIFRSRRDLLPQLLLPPQQDRSDRRRDGMQPDMMKRRLREGVEFFDFLKERRNVAA